MPAANPFVNPGGTLLHRRTPSDPCLSDLVQPVVNRKPRTLHVRHASEPRDSRNLRSVAVSSTAVVEAPTTVEVGPQLGWPSRLEDTYRLGKLLGTGSYGVVHEAIHKQSGAVYAVKVLRKGGPRTSAVETLARVSREAEVLQALDGCPQVARLVAKYETARFVYLVMEKCTGENLLDVLKGRKRLPEAQVCCIMFECLQTLAACHEQHILHGDVKPANFMLKHRLDDTVLSCSDVEAQGGSVLKAVDFGCSRMLQPGEYLDRLLGSPAYMAPEVNLLHYGLEADMWSLGVMFYQLVTGRLPFWSSLREMESATMDDLKRAVLREEIHLDCIHWGGMSPEAVDLARGLLERDPQERFTARQALEHPWFKLCGCKTSDSVRIVWRNNVLPFAVHHQ